MGKIGNPEVKGNGNAAVRGEWLFKDSYKNGSSDREKSVMQMSEMSTQNSDDANVSKFNKVRSRLSMGDYENGLKEVQYAAQQGLKKANFLLGYCYEKGIGVKTNLQVAKAYYRLATISDKEYESYYGPGGLTEPGIKKASKEGELLLKRGLKS